MSVYISKIKRFIYGLIIGIAAVTPGVSGGVIAAAYGIYEPSIRAISDIRHTPKKSFGWLIPIGMGILIGIMVFARLLMNLIENNYNTVMVIFCGLVAGSIPSVVKMGTAEIKKSKYIIIFLLAFSISLYLSSYADNIRSELPLNIARLITGAVVSVGTVVPGISTSFILIKLGFYDMYINCLGGNDIPGAVIIAFSFGLTSLVLFRIIDMIFKRYRGTAYCVVCGFLSASVFAVFPDVEIMIHQPLYIILLLLSVFTGFILTKG